MGAATVPTKFGRMLVPPEDRYVGRALAENGVYAPDEFAGWVPYLPVGGAVLDVGANIGGHTFAFAKAVGKTGIVIAVEPQRMLFAMLCGSQAMLGAKNVWPRWCALGKTPGVVYVPDLDYDGPNNFGALSLDTNEVGDPVARVTLDQWGLSRLDFLKVDVEGMELDVLLGGEQTIARTRPVIVAEADRKDRYAPLLDWALRHKYRPYLQTPKLGVQWGETRCKNLLCLPIERDLPTPDGPDIASMPELAALIGV